eukprot:IDg12388t1
MVTRDARRVHVAGALRAAARPRPAPVTNPVWCPILSSRCVSSRRRCAAMMTSIVLVVLLRLPAIILHFSCALLILLLFVDRALQNNQRVRTVLQNCNSTSNCRDYQASPAVIEYMHIFITGFIVKKDGISYAQVKFMLKGDTGVLNLSPLK